ncbi:MAG: hypothetical protein K6G64_09855 [Eubacterium sp.]|nr:hypothetical protein [Eubacterium sp.]
MKTLKKMCAGLLVIALMLGIMPIVSEESKVQAATSISVTAPANNALVAAGYIDIKWNSVSNAKNYTLFINDTQVTTLKETSFVYYTTEVAYHTVYVKANFENGTSVTSAKNKFGVSKKGLCLATDMGRNAKLKEWGVAWYYNWGNTPSSGSQYAGVEYVPMVWSEYSAANFKKRLETYKSQGYKYTLTFNEPDMGSSVGGCNMSVDQVYNVWQGIADMKGIQVSAPATAGWPQAKSNWFKQFMDKLTKKDYDPDFIAIHCYPEDYAGKEMAQWFLEEIIDWTWNAYHKPIWITEFSTHGQYVNASGNNGTKEFWEAVMPGLDARPYVERYAAFGFNSANSENCGLWNYSTGSLTAGGQVYVSKGLPTEAAKEPVTTVPTTKDEVTKPVVKKEVKKPAKVKIKSAKKKKNAKKAKIVIAKVKGAKGYQIRYCDDRSFQGYETKTIKKNIRKITLKGLDRKTQYWVKIRAFNKKNNGKKQYGKWSSKKKIKMK